MDSVTRDEVEVEHEASARLVSALQSRGRLQSSREGYFLAVAVESINDAPTLNCEPYGTEECFEVVIDEGEEIERLGVHLNDPDAVSMQQIALVRQGRAKSNEYSYIM